MLFGCPSDRPFIVRLPVNIHGFRDISTCCGGISIKLGANI